MNSGKKLPVLFLLLLFTLFTPGSLSGAICSNTSTGRIPLTELGTGTYLGFQGGLYPAGSNTRPIPHTDAGILLSYKIRPRNAKGVISPNGKIVLLSIGMSNATQEFSAFMTMANDDPQKNPKVLAVDGAQSGMSADRIYDLNSQSAQNYWNNHVAGRIQAAGITPKQVQAVWIKQADGSPLPTFPAHANQLKTELTAILQILKTRFPHLQTVYLSSRIYGGYADNQIERGEPLSYETGFAVKWLIEDQINGLPELNYDWRNGEARAPWISWGPYIWADGTTPRSDGLFYLCADFQTDGIHPANGGRQKVAQRLLDFFKTDPTTRRWFLANP